FAARLGIGVGHARGIALMPRGDQFDAGLRQSVRDLEVGGAEKGKAAPRTIAGQIAGDHVGDDGVGPAHDPSAPRGKSVVRQSHNTRPRRAWKAAGLTRSKSFRVKYLSLK